MPSSAEELSRLYRDRLSDSIRLTGQLMCGESTPTDKLLARMNDALAAIVHSSFGRPSWEPLARLYKTLEQLQSSLGDKYENLAIFYFARSLAVVLEEGVRREEERLNLTRMAEDMSRQLERAKREGYGSQKTERGPATKDEGVQTEEYGSGELRASVPGVEENPRSSSTTAAVEEKKEKEYGTQKEDYGSQKEKKVAVATAISPSAYGRPPNYFAPRRESEQEKQELTEWGKKQNAKSAKEEYGSEQKKEDTVVEKEPLSLPSLALPSLLPSLPSLPSTPATPSTALFFSPSELDSDDEVEEEKEEEGEVKEEKREVDEWEHILPPDFPRGTDEEMKGILTINGISPSLGREQLASFLEMMGRVVELRYYPNWRGWLTGFAVCRYESEEAADLAHVKFNHKVFFGTQLHVRRAKPRVTREAVADAAETPLHPTTTSSTDTDTVEWDAESCGSLNDLD